MVSTDNIAVPKKIAIAAYRKLEDQLSQPDSLRGGERYGMSPSMYSAFYENNLGENTDAKGFQQTTLIHGSRASTYLAQWAEQQK